jgi:hypothetical protein
VIARRWGLGVTLLAMAAVAILVLPPRPVPDRYSFIQAVLGFSYRDWSGNSGDYTATVKQARNRFAAALAARAHGAADVQASRGPLALRSMHEPLVVVRDPDVPIATAREWLTDAEKELSLFPRAAGAGVPVIIALHSRDFVPSSGLQHSVSVGARMLYTEGRDTVCITDLRVPGRDTTMVPTRYWHLQSAGWWENRRMGRCALYARYGIPGREVQAWYGLSSRWRWSDDGALRVSLAQRAVRRRPIERDPQWGYGSMPQYFMCLDQGVACGGIFGLQANYDFESWYYRGRGASLIAELLKSRGPDRFVRFWQSALPVDSALQGAYGVSIDVLGRETLLRELIPAEPAGAHRGATATSVVWLAGLLGLAMVLSRRQTMGL